MFNYPLYLNQDELMKNFYAKFDPNKISGLINDLDYDTLANSIDKLYTLQDEIEKNYSESVTRVLKNYTIVNLVTIIEDTAKKMLKRIIDEHEYPLNALFGRNEIHMKLHSLNKLHQKYS